ncbi:methylmalonyl-CoA epimerase [Nakamurella lactea]|uniref:methylmalonyl-CoA epimerase n=1 Tax=Nakamurella lactea TaxID=459515 RepID=UPI00048CCD13|nr:methylmalonyl-CoA epimerase [Nakamurella lactea]
MTIADRLDVLAIDHVGIAVPDLEAAITMYTGPFGGRVAHRETNPDQQVDEAMIAFDDGTQLQLIAPTSPDSSIGKFIDRSGPGLQQLAFRVPDVAAAAATLRDAGMRLLYDEPRTGTAGSRINFVHPKDAGGVLVELVQPMAERSGAPAHGTESR